MERREKQGQHGRMEHGTQPIDPHLLISTNISMTMHIDSLVLPVLKNLAPPLERE